jgi:hypothetical protein
MSLNPSTVISEFVLAKLPQEPVHRRIEITRALAAISGCTKQRADLLSVANLLEDVERNHHQLWLEFKRRHEGQS